MGWAAGDGGVAVVAVTVALAVVGDLAGGGGDMPGSICQAVTSPSRWSNDRGGGAACVNASNSPATVAGRSSSRGGDMRIVRSGGNTSVMVCSGSCGSSKRAGADSSATSAGLVSNSPNPVGRSCRSISALSLPVSGS